MYSEDIDLRDIPVSCASHPIIKLKDTIKILVEKGVKEIRVFFRVGDVPENLVKFILSKHGYSIEELRKLNNGSLLIIAKRSERRVLS